MPNELTTTLEHFDASRLVQLIGDPLPVDLYEEARRVAPVCRNPESGIWFVTGNAEVRVILEDARAFSSQRHWIPETLPSEVMEVLSRGVHITNTYTSDPPDHARLRGNLAAALTPQHVAALEPSIRNRANALIDRLVDKGGMDFVHEFGYPLCLGVTADLLGVREEDHALLKRWETAYIMLTHAAGTLAEQLIWAQDIVDNQRYFAEMIEECRIRSCDGLVGALAAPARGDERYLETSEIIGEALSIQVAGTDLPVQLLRCLVQSLLPQPVGLNGSARQIGTAIEEAARQTLLGFFRTTTTPVEVGGVHIPAGEQIYLVVAAANRDERSISCPAAFDVDRTNPTRHYGFGHGPHFCLGTHLTRAEGRITVEVLKERLPNLHVEAGFVPRYIPTTAFRKVDELRLTWDI